MSAQREPPTAEVAANVRAALSAQPLLLQAGGGGGAGGTGGGGSGGTGGAGGGSGGPGQSSAAPQPAVGPKSAPELTAPSPYYGPLDEYFALKKRLKQATGTVPRLNVDLTTQSVVHGPDEFTKWVWRYDFGVQQNLWKGAKADLDIRGGEGDDAASALGSTMNLNQYGGTPTTGFILHLWIEQKLFDDQLTLRGGKLDLGDWMDVNRFGYYNLLGFSQNHNNAIPFPGNPLAAMFTIEPKNVPWLYFSAGIANARQSSLNAGFEELTDGRTAPFTMAELGLKLEFNGQPGIYRFIGWYDGRDLAPIGRVSDAGGSSDGRYGVAVSFDQNLTRDIGLFARYGFADQSEFNPRHYWQAGFDWKGVVPGRPKDDLAVGVVQNIFADARRRAVVNAADYETYVEAYYNVVVYDWLQVQPVLQVLANPGGVTQEPAWILGVHVAFRL